MPLVIGSSLGPYQILAPLGAGGMGEVYRAHDSTLGRDVAIKILPEAWVTDPDRRARLDREARVLASLNHPNIGAIYGLEAAGTTRALVLELVHGPTLAERLGSRQRSSSSGSGKSATPSTQQGRRLSIPEALDIARQIADALEAAHEKGIIHRDLKPTNVKITPQGVVKVLDFGLATYQARVGFEPVAPVENPVTQAATMLIDGTQEGMVLGTAGYMSPEQARGQPVDKRSDIWSFGCVLFEMLSGISPFRRETTSDSVAAVLTTDPDWHALPNGMPGPVRRLLERCLTKDPRQRLRDIGDARIEINEALASPDGAMLTDIGRTNRWPKGLSLLAPLIAAAVTGLIVWNVKPGPAPSAMADRSVVRLVIAPPPNEPLIVDRPTLAISPDGRTVAYVAGRGSRQRIYLREVGQFQSTPVPGTEGGFSPFFSTDGQWLGFFADRKMKRVLRTGGLAVSIADVADSGVSSSVTASWSTQDTIFFTPDLSSGIWRTTPAGAPIAVTTLSGNETVHYWPQLLPGGKAMLFSASGDGPEPQVYVQLLETGQRRSLDLRGIGARFVPTGHIVYVQGGTLMAVPFDPGRLEMTGPPVAVLSGVMDASRLRTTVSNLVPLFNVSDAGTLAYVPASSDARQHSLVWVDRSGNEQPTGASGGIYFHPRLSPDGRRIALTVRGAEHDDVWLYDLGRQTWSRFTSDGNSGFPLWTQDGQRIAYNADHAGSVSIYWKRLDGSTPAEPLVSSPRAVYSFPFSWSPDGTLAFVSIASRAVQDIWVMRPDGDRRPSSVVETPFAEGAPAFSPDGRWLAYVSNETGRSEIYVRPFPGPGERITVSTEGGNEAVWPRNGRELFFRNGDAMMAVDISTTPTLSVGRPRKLFEKRYEPSLALYPNYGVTADGQRFVMIKRIDQGDAPAQINTVLNAFEELRRPASAQAK